MGFRVVLLLLAVVWNVGPPLVASAQSGSRLPRPASEVYRDVSPYLVTVVTEDSDGSLRSQGSGFILGDKLMVTNLHVMKYAVAVSAKIFAGGVTYTADKVVAFSRTRDLCVLELSSSPCAPAADGRVDQCGPPIDPQGAVRIGDDVLVMGTPRGLEGTISKGIISGIRAEPKLLQLDAAVSPGSSGGPVLNVRGEIIGVVVSTIVGGQNLNFAIPIEDVLSLPFTVVDIRTAGGVAVFDREDDRLRGPVKTVTERKAEFSYSQRSDTYAEQPPERECSETYDVNGNKIRMDFKDLMTGEVFSYCSSFNEEGLLSREGVCPADEPVSRWNAVFRTGTHIFGTTQTTAAEKRCPARHSATNRRRSVGFFTDF